MKTGLVVAVFTLGISLPALGKDHASKYQVGVFTSTGQLSDGSFINCGNHSCASYSAAHNIHYIRTSDGLYAIEAPVSVGKSMMVGMFTEGLGPTVYQQWFMDQLHEGDKVLFYSKCNKHNNCTFALPNPDKVGKEYYTTGYYRADIAKTNTQTLCGKGKLSPDVEAQVCPVVAATANSAAQPTK